MAIRNLRYDNDEVLRKRSKEVETIDNITVKSITVKIITTNRPKISVAPYIDRSKFISPPTEPDISLGSESITAKKETTAEASEVIDKARTFPNAI